MKDLFAPSLTHNLHHLLETYVLILLQLPFRSEIIKSLLHRVQVKKAYKICYKCTYILTIKKNFVMHRRIKIRHGNEMSCRISLSANGAKGYLCHGNVLFSYKLNSLSFLIPVLVAILITIKMSYACLKNHHITRLVF